MAARTPFRITPSLGPDLWKASTEFYWDTISVPVNSTAAKVPSYQLGSVVVGNDGHEYKFVQTTGTIASGAAVTLTEPANTVATGAGPWTVPATGASIPAGTFLHVRKTAIA